MSFDEDVRLRRIEVMLRRLTGSLNPQISIGEIQALLGLSDRSAVEQWLEEHKLKPVARWRYRRADVMGARDTELGSAVAEAEGEDRIAVELSSSQLETLCWFIVDELTSAMLEPVLADDFLAVVRAWRDGRITWVDRYLERYIENREHVENLGRRLDDDAYLLEQLASRLS